MSDKIVHLKSYQDKRKKAKLVASETHEEVGQLYARDLIAEFHKNLNNERGKKKNECTKPII